MTLARIEKWSRELRGASKGYDMLQTSITFSCNLCPYQPPSTSTLHVDADRLLACPIPASIKLWLLKPRHSRVSFRGPPCAHGVLGTPHGEVCDTHPHQMEWMPSLIMLVVGTPILKLSFSLGATLCFPWGTTLIIHLQIWQSPKGVVPRWSISNLEFLFQGPKLQ